MLIEQNIADYLSLQPYEYIGTETSEDGRRIQLNLASRSDTDEAACPYCGSRVHICGNCSMRLRDMPVPPGTRQDLKVVYHRYRCLGCRRTFREEIIQIPTDEDNRARGCMGKLAAALQPAYCL